MQLRKIAVGIIENVYGQYKDWQKYTEQFDLKQELNDCDHSIPVWDSMDDNTKCAAIEYVYLNRDKIELNSSCVEAWVQAAAYYMFYKFFDSIIIDGEPMLDVFFDDMDFELDKELLKNPDFKHTFGVQDDYTDPF